MLKGWAFAEISDRSAPDCHGAERKRLHKRGLGYRDTVHKPVVLNLAIAGKLMSGCKEVGNHCSSVPRCQGHRGHHHHGAHMV